MLCAQAQAGVEDDRAKVAEEEARLNELRARSRAGKERQVRISERTLQEWQRTMDGRKIPIPHPDKVRGGGSNCGSTMD
jgi:hypothetical protein